MRLIAATAAAGLALAACGSSSSNGESAKAAAQILADAKKATSAASSVHVSGSIKQSAGTETVNVNVAHGDGGGTISQGAEVFQIVEHSPDIYLKANTATWTKLSGAKAAQLLANKWIQTTTGNSDFSQLSQVADISQLVNSLSPSGKLTKGSTTTFNGKSAISLDDQGSGSGPGLLYVATTGKPYILGLAGSGSSSGKIIFDDYGTAKVPGPPSGSISLSTLEKTAGGS